MKTFYIFLNWSTTTNVQKLIYVLENRNTHLTKAMTKEITNFNQIKHFKDGTIKILMHVIYTECYFNNGQSLNCSFNQMQVIQHLKLKTKDHTKDLFT